MSRRILITGGARRLGKTLTEHYLELGCEVVAHYNSRNELTPHPSLRVIQGNLGDNADTLRLCQELAKEKPFDVVIHNASCFAPDASAGFTPAEQAAHINKHLNVHVTAPMLITQALSNSWNEDASMVVISDIYVDIPNHRFAAYCASKAALHNWALSMAQRLAGKVRVNILQPGPIQFLPDHTEEYRNQVLSQSLIRRELGYGSIVKACDYLIDNDAVTGSAMRVDGGRFVANRYDQTFAE